MPNPVVDATIAQITATDNVIDGATQLVNGIAAQISAAVTAALANGATAAELQPLSDLSATLGVKSSALAAAVAANTPALAPTSLQLKAIQASQKA